MNKCYFGNFQDFCKYGLLRELANWSDGDFNFRLCFGQMTTPDRAPASTHNWDYLENNGDLCSLDRELFERLRGWRMRGESAGESWMEISRQLFPEAVMHHDDEVPVDSQNRGEFFRHMADAFGGGDTVFLNPDYGLDLAARLLKAGNTGDVNNRFLTTEEILMFIRKGKSVLFYQEALLFPRESRDNLQRDVMQHLRNAEIINRVYFFESRAPSYSKDEETAQSGFFWIASPRHIKYAEKFYRHFQKSEWCKKGIGILDGKECFNAVRRVGIFVDPENTSSVPELRHILNNIRGKVEAVTPAVAVVHRAAYGKQGAKKGTKSEAANIDGTIAFLKEQKFKTSPVKPGADEADFNLYCDIGRSIFQSHIDIAIVVTGDADFRFVARQARGLGVQYFGVGSKKTNNAYRDECDVFYELRGSAPANYQLVPGIRKKEKHP